MKINYIILLFYVVCSTSCHSQEKRNDMSESGGKDISISLKFYPKGVIEDVRYSINIINDSLIVKNHFPRNINDNREYGGQLSNEKWLCFRILCEVKFKVGFLNSPVYT